MKVVLANDAPRRKVRHAPPLALVLGLPLVACGSSAGAERSSAADGGARPDASAHAGAPQPVDAGADAPVDLPDAGPSDSGGEGAAGGLHVEGNQLVDQGKVVRLLGVDRSGTEYMCIGGDGIFDGPVDQTATSAITGWHTNAVRVPLNEDCWLDINGAPAAYSGSAYQTAIMGYVSLLRQNGLYVILDLHWNGPGTTKATGQLPMADADHAPAFWTSVASAFASDPGVVFDLYNEPFVTSWGCWLNGCEITGSSAGNYMSAGMQQLLDAVRATGAKNVVMAGGLAYANDLSEWLANEPNDSAGALAASFHNYNFNTCSTTACWTTNIASVAARVPVITGEMGENDCAAGYIDGYMPWADDAGVSYLGWAWNADFDCSTGPSLITDYTGTPTAFGAGLQTHLAAIHP